jgi:hypothetical protein
MGKKVNKKLLFVHLHTLNIRIKEVTAADGLEMVELGLPGGPNLLFWHLLLQLTAQVARASQLIEEIVPQKEELSVSHHIVHHHQI